MQSAASSIETVRRKAGAYFSVPRPEHTRELFERQCQVLDDIYGSLLVPEEPQEEAQAGERLPDLMRKLVDDKPPRMAAVAKDNDEFLFRLLAVDCIGAIHNETVYAQPTLSLLIAFSKEDDAEELASFDEMLDGEPDMADLVSFFCDQSGSDHLVCFPELEGLGLARGAEADREYSRLLKAASACEDPEDFEADLSSDAALNALALALALRLRNRFPLDNSVADANEAVIEALSATLKGKLSGAAAEMAVGALAEALRRCRTQDEGARVCADVLDLIAPAELARIAIRSSLDAMRAGIASAARCSEVAALQTRLHESTRAPDDSPRQAGPAGRAAAMRLAAKLRKILQANGCDAEDIDSLPNGFGAVLAALVPGRCREFLLERFRVLDSEEVLIRDGVAAMNELAGEETPIALLNVHHNRYALCLRIELALRNKGLFSRPGKPRRRRFMTTATLTYGYACGGLQTVAEKVNERRRLWFICHNDGEHLRVFCLPALAVEAISALDEFHEDPRLFHRDQEDEGEGVALASNDKNIDGEERADDENSLTNLILDLGYSERRPICTPENLRRFERCVRRGASLHHRDPTQSPLGWAIYFDDIELLDWMLCQGARLPRDLKGVVGLIEHAVRTCGVPMLDRLEQLCGGVHGDSGRLLHALCQAGVDDPQRPRDDEAVWNWVWARSSNVNFRDPVGDYYPTLGATPLMATICRNRLAFASRLLEAGPELDICDAYGNTALHHCAGMTWTIDGVGLVWEWHETSAFVMGELIRAGVALDVPNDSGAGALDLALIEACEPAIEQLRRAGARTLLNEEQRRQYPQERYEEDEDD